MEYYPLKNVQEGKIIVQYVAQTKNIRNIAMTRKEKKEDDFGPVFYNDLIAKMILFRESDSSIRRSDWYQAEKGFKAEAVTFTLALLRHALLKNKQDINLDRIFKNQTVSVSLMDFIISLAERVRGNIADPIFRNGVANPSEFCKSEKGWKKIQSMAMHYTKKDLEVLI